MFRLPEQKMIVISAGDAKYVTYADAEPLLAARRGLVPEAYPDQ